MKLLAWYTKNKWRDAKQVVVVGAITPHPNEFRSSTTEDFRIICVDKEGDMFLASPLEIKISNPSLLFQ